MNLITQYKGLRREIYILFFGKIVTNLGSMVWPLMTMILSRKLFMNATQIAWLNIAAGAIFLPVSIIGGKLADRFNKKHIIVNCDLLSITFYFICASIPISLTSVILLYIAGALQGLENPSYNALVADMTLSKDRERAYSLLYLGLNIGLVASPTIAGLLFENYLHVAFAISGASIAMSTILIIFKVKNITPVEEHSVEAQYQEAKDGLSIFQVLKQNKVVLLYQMIAMLYWGAYNQYGFLMPLDMGNLHGEKGAVIFGSISSLNCITVVFFTPILTRLLAKVISTRKILIGHALLMFGYMSFLLSRGVIPFYYVAMYLFTLGEIVACISSGPYMTQRIPASHRGRIEGVMSIAQGTINAVLMLCIGKLYDTVSPTSAWALVLTLLGTSIVLCFVLIVLDRKAYPALYLSSPSSGESTEEVLQTPQETAGPV